MWNANELLNYAIRQLTEMLKKEQTRVIIILKENFVGDENELNQLFEELKIKENTQIIRKKFQEYCVGSTVKRVFTHIVTFTDSPCQYCFKIEWEINVSKK